MAASPNKYSFRRIHMLTLFCIRTNLRENRFFAAKCGLVSRKGTYNVKIFTKNITTVDKLTSWWVQSSFHLFQLTRWPVNELTSWWRSHLFTFSPFHPFTFSPFHLFTFSPFHPFTFSPFHPFTLSSFHLFTLSSFHLFTLSPFHLFTFSPFHPFTFKVPSI